MELHRLGEDRVRVRRLRDDGALPGRKLGRTLGGGWRDEGRQQDDEHCTNHPVIVPPRRRPDAVGAGQWRCGAGSPVGSPEPERRPWSDHRRGGVLADLQQRVDRRVPEHLARLAGRPRHLDRLDGGGAAQADVLGVAVRAERAAARHLAIAQPAALAGVLLARPPTMTRIFAPIPARFDRVADQPELEPVLARRARVLEQRVVVAVARHRAAGVQHDVLVAVVIEIGEGDAVPLLQMAGAGGLGHVVEAPAGVVAQQDVRDQRAERRRPGAEVDVEEAVVVDVADVGAHRRHDARDAGRGRHVGEPAPPVVAIQLQRLGRGG